MESNSGTEMSANQFVAMIQHPFLSSRKTHKEGMAKNKGRKARGMDQVSCRTTDALQYAKVGRGF